jgi:hypothetical protein
MIKMTYPERRQVSEDTIIGWAHDQLVNDAFRDLPKEVREYDEGAMKRLSNSIEKPTVEEAIYILEDSGVCSFQTIRS